MAAPVRGAASGVQQLCVMSGDGLLEAGRLNACVSDVERRSTHFVHCSCQDLLRGDVERARCRLMLEHLLRLSKPCRTLHCAPWVPNCLSGAIARATRGQSNCRGRSASGVWVAAMPVVCRWPQCRWSAGGRKASGLPVAAMSVARRWPQCR